jgi:hypothetical protein
MSPGLSLQKRSDHHTAGDHVLRYWYCKFTTPFMFHVLPYVTQTRKPENLTTYVCPNIEREMKPHKTNGTNDWPSLTLSFQSFQPIQSFIQWEKPEL